MYINVIFLLYIIALLISLVCLVFIGLVFVRKKDRNNKTYIAVRRFALVAMLVDILYFVFFYREIVLRKYELMLPFRVADYIVCTAIFLCWFLVMAYMSGAEKHRGFIRAGIILTVVRLAASLAVTSVYMDSYYSIANSEVCRLWVIIESIFVLMTFALVIYGTVRTVKVNIASLRKKYVIVSSVLLLIWEAVQHIVDTGLFEGEYGMSAWSLEVPDFTGAIMFMLNLATCVFVFKEDFSPLFLGEAESGDSYDRLTGELDEIAAVYKLTVREREVLEMVYQGCTNPDIAKLLHISLNTAKKHTHNIFDKLNMSNRMEVVHFINEKMIK